MDKYQDKINWEPIAEHQKNLSEDFMDRHFDKLDKRDISAHQILSENFMQRHADKLDWNIIKKYQPNVTTQLLSDNASKIDDTRPDYVELKQKINKYNLNS